MKILEVKSLTIPDVKIIKTARFRDERGYFTETFRSSDLKKVIPDFSIQQVNESYSSTKGVLRGLHLQWNPYMGKLVRTLSGHMIDIVLDIRKGSPYFGKIIGYDMPASKLSDYFEWIWIPVGFAHGNFFLEETSIEYFCTGEYNPENGASILPLAPDLDWSLCEKSTKGQFDEFIKNKVIVSEKDQRGLTLGEWSKDKKSDNFIYNA